MRARSFYTKTFFNFFYIGTCLVNYFFAPLKYIKTKAKKILSVMKILNTTKFLFRGEIIGYVFDFDFDCSVTTDINGEIIDYSGKLLPAMEATIKRNFK